MRTLLLIFVVLSSSLSGQEKSKVLPAMEKVINEYYTHWHNWAYEKMVKLYHPDFKKAMSKVMKIKEEDFDKQMVKNLNTGLKLKYKNQKEYAKINNYKLDAIELNNTDEGSYLLVVTVSGTFHGKKSKGKMVFVLRKHEGKFKVADMARYDRYMSVVKSVEEKKKAKPVEEKKGE